MPRTSIRSLSMGRRISPSLDTRTVRVNSGAPYTETASRSVAPMGCDGRFAPGGSTWAVSGKARVNIAAKVAANIQ